MVELQTLGTASDHIPKRRFSEMPSPQAVSMTTHCPETIDPSSLMQLSATCLRLPSPISAWETVPDVIALADKVNDGPSGPLSDLNIFLSQGPTAPLCAGPQPEQNRDHSDVSGQGVGHSHSLSQVATEPAPW